MGFSPNAPVAVGNWSAGTAAATTVAAGTSGPRVAASLLGTVEPFASVTGPEEEAAVDVVADVSTEEVPEAQAPSTTSGRTATTARTRTVRTIPVNPVKA
ncbi:hypothetical protein GCM10009818_07320 [Nakamurella flavida]